MGAHESQQLQHTHTHRESEKAKRKKERQDERGLKERREAISVSVYMDDGLMGDAQLGYRLGAILTVCKGV